MATRSIGYSRRTRRTANSLTLKDDFLRAPRRGERLGLPVVNAKSADQKEEHHCLMPEYQAAGEGWGKQAQAVFSTRDVTPLASPEEKSGVVKDDVQCCKSADRIEHRYAETPVEC